MLYVTAKSTWNLICKRYEQFGAPLSVDRTIIPDEDDKSTLFICSGMQRVKRKFSSPDLTKLGTLQSCIRTNDLELVGDGSHLTYFEMLGNFSFGGNDYENSVELWNCIIQDLKLPITHITIHPSRQDHIEMWKKRNYPIILDNSCEWSDGMIGGNCCEVFVKDLEIGNLVNPLGHSTDVGFGWERLIQIVEGKEKVDQTSLFNQNFHPIVKDHIRTLMLLWQNGIHPGSKGRNYVCRRLVRRILPYLASETFVFSSWIESEKELLQQKLKTGRRSWKRFKDRSLSFWWETFGILPEEVPLLKE